MTVDEDPNETISVPDTLNILNVTVHSISERRISIPIRIETDHNTEKTHALVDCGAEGLFIDKSIAHKWKRQPINPIKVRNVDGTLNIEGEINEKCLITFDMNGRNMTEWFLVSALGSRKMILGLPWLEEKTLEFRNSDIKDEEIPSRSTCRVDSVTVSEREDDLVIRYLQSHKGSLSEDRDRKVNPFEGDHKIELREDFKPKKGKIYPLSPKQQKTLDEWLAEQLEKGYISRSESEQASPFFFVEKKEAGKLRPCQDYRYLNEFTKPNSYPLPLISDLMIKLKGSKYFTKLDIRWGYNNVQIKKEDRWKAAFVTNRGLFEPNVMMFGLRNSPATFQAMMDDYFRDLTDKGWLVIYMDDILIHARTKEELENRTKQVLERLKNNDLYLKPEKCKFAQREVEFLGMIVTENTIKMDPIKLAGIRDWPTPTTVKQVRSFLGFGNYYRKFISGFAHLARPLHELTKKNKIWTWTVECQVAFDLLKERFTSAPVLQMPDVNLPFILQTDASDRTIGAVLMQAD